MSWKKHSTGLLSTKTTVYNDEFEIFSIVANTFTHKEFVAQEDSLRNQLYKRLYSLQVLLITSPQYCHKIALYSEMFILGDFPGSLAPKCCKGTNQHVMLSAKLLIGLRGRNQPAESNSSDFDADNSIL